jgi:transposase-like protein
LTPKAGPLAKVEKGYNQPSQWRVKAMSKQRSRYSAQFKFQLALEAAKGLKTLNELASEHSVHPNQISEWKRRLLEGGSTIFSRDGAHSQREHQEREVALYEQIGRLKMELEWLKKKAARFG